MTDKSPLEGPLHTALCHFLPFFVDTPFSPKPKLKVYAIHPELGMSHEGVYKWLRDDRLTPAGAEKLVNLACSNQQNRDILRLLGRETPSLTDFQQFIPPRRKAKTDS